MNIGFPLKNSLGLISGCLKKVFISNNDIFIGLGLFLISSIVIFFGLDYHGGFGADQKDVERISLGIAKLQSFNQASLSHGLGYSFLILPFQLFPSINALNAANGVLFTASFSAGYRAIRSWQLNRKRQIMLFSLLALSFVASPDIYFWVIGASNAVSAALIVCLIAWSLSRTPPKHLPLYVAFLFGLDFSARYIDPILLSPLFLSSILNYSRAYRKNIWSQILRMGVLSIVFVIPTLCFHFFTLGSVFATPYDDKVPATARLLTSSLSGEGIADQTSGRYVSWIFPNLYSTLIDPGIWASDQSLSHGKTALQFSPILALFPFSFFLGLLGLGSNVKPHRVFIALVSISLILWTIFYASGWAFTTHDLRYYSLRYFMGWFTCLVFFSCSIITLSGDWIRYLYALIMSIPVYVSAWIFTQPALASFIINSTHHQYVDSILISTSQSDQTASKPHSQIRYNMPPVSQSTTLITIATGHHDNLLLSYDTLRDKFVFRSCIDRSNQSNAIDDSITCEASELSPKNNLSMNDYFSFENGFRILGFKQLQDKTNLLRLCILPSCDDNIHDFELNDSGKLILSKIKNKLSPADLDNPDEFLFSSLPWFPEMELTVDVPTSFQQLDLFRLNFWMSNSIDEFFPDQISLSCFSREKMIENCSIVKMGRLNNLWSLWVDSKILSARPITSIRVKMMHQFRENPDYFPLLKLFFSR